jgi:lipopolysaccharide assembly protein A
MTATQNRPDRPGPDTATTRPGGGGGQPGDRGTGTQAKVPRSRMGGVWVALVVAALVFLLLLIFILQNGQRAQVSFLGAHGHLPMGVALLLAAVFGVLLVALPGTARIIQLRMLGRRRGTADEPQLPPPATDSLPPPATDSLRS